MAYTTTNFRSKKALRDAVASGAAVTVFQPGPFGPATKANGIVSLEGPHYPQAHTWYARATVVNGLVTQVK